MDDAAQPEGDQNALEEAKARREEARREVEREAEAASRGEELSKSARKRIIKLQQLDARKEKRKEDKKLRKQNRKTAQSAAMHSAGGAAPPDDHADAAGPREPRSQEEHAAASWAQWEALGSPRLVLAPMVNQSELAFRMLARRYGAQLCYTPMLHSTLFSSEEYYRVDNFDPHAAEGPLVVQFCGDDPSTVLAAAQLAQSQCVAIDLNCGCPQGIAKRGHYGAFLLDEPHIIEAIVARLASGLRCPAWVKMRLLPSANGSPDVQATIALALRLQAAGCSVLALHGRTREQKCAVQCDWAAIRAVKGALAIPVIANGGVETPEDLDACLAATAADAVMLSEAALENPAIFGRTPTTRAGQAKLAREYVELARRYPPRTISVCKAHLFKLLFMALEQNRDLRTELGAATDVDQLFAVAETVCQKEDEAMAADPDAMRARCDLAGAPHTTWYRRHRTGVPASADRYGGAAPKADAA